MILYELESRKTRIRNDTNFIEYLLKNKNVLSVYLNQGNSDFDGMPDSHYIERQSNFYYDRDMAYIMEEFEYLKHLKCVVSGPVIWIQEAFLRKIEKDEKGNVTKSLIKYYCSEVDDHGSEKETQTGGTK